MPFFEGSKNFNINGGEMNDVGGNLVKNTTSNKTYNTDSFNTSTGSKISKGDKVSQNMNIGICPSDLIIMLFRVVQLQDRPITVPLAAECNKWEGLIGRFAYAQPR